MPAMSPTSGSCNDWRCALLGAAERYADPAHRDDLRARLADHALVQLEAAAPGSDAQVVWARQLASAAHPRAHLDRVHQLLDGAWVVDGLEVDTELRWHLVTMLAREGAVGPDAIAAELDRDRTDIGERHALTARAALPDPQHKQEAWDRLLQDTTLSHTKSRHIWRGFQQLTQAHLLSPYVPAYFDALDGVWRERPKEWAIEFSEDMFPHPAMSPDVVDRTTTMLDRDDLPPPLRRVLLEQRDLLERALRARAADAA
jgi:aminopeptidase N